MVQRSARDVGRVYPHDLVPLCCDFLHVLVLFLTFHLPCTLNSVLSLLNPVSPLARVTLTKARPQANAVKIPNHPVFFPFSEFVVTVPGSFESSTIHWLTELRIEATTFPTLQLSIHSRYFFSYFKIIFMLLSYTRMLFTLPLYSPYAPLTHT